MGSEDRFWRSRLRWRFQGATQWPAFVATTLLDGLIIWKLPPVAFREPDPLVSVLIATFGNLILLGAVAPFLAKRLARRRALAAGASSPALVEREVLQDRVATLLLAAGVVAALVSGLGNRPVVVSETRDTEEVVRQLDIYVSHSGNAELRRNREEANTHRLGEGYFRVCIPRDDRRKNVCLFVDTKKDPTSVRRDPSNESNTELFGLDDH